MRMLTPDQVLGVVCDVYRVGRDGMTSQARRPDLALARHAYCWAARRYTGASWTEIGRPIDRYGNAAQRLAVAAAADVSIDTDRERLVTRLTAIAAGREGAGPVLPPPVRLAVARLDRAVKTLCLERYGPRERAAADELIAAATAASEVLAKTFESEVTR